MRACQVQRFAVNILLLLLLRPGSAGAQAAAPCSVLQNAQRKNQRVRLTFDSTVIEGRVYESNACPGGVRLNRAMIEFSSLSAIDVRQQHPDPLGNGVGIGFLSGGLVMGLIGPIATGGDAPFLRSAIIGAVPGALVGFILDVTKQRPPDWLRLWP